MQEDHSLRIGMKTTGQLVKDSWFVSCRSDFATAADAGKRD